MSRRLIAVLVVLTGLCLAGRAWGVSFSLEIRGGYHLPRSAEFREIYGGGLAFGGQIELRLTNSLSAWAGADYLGRTGRITFTGEETKIRIVPVTAGVKVQVASASVRPYAAAGLGYVLYREDNVIGPLRGGVLGFLGQAGVVIRLTSRLSLDLYGRFLAAKSKAGEPDVLSAELGGFQGGLGLVVGF